MSTVDYGDTLALFDLTPVDDREGNAADVHVLLPNMAYACGGNILTKQGKSRCGASEWDLITCTECRAHGRDALIAETNRQQGKANHRPTCTNYPAPQWRVPNTLCGCPSKEF